MKVRWGTMVKAGTGRMDGEGKRIVVKGRMVKCGEGWNRNT